MTRKTKCSAEKWERLRQFEVVCKMSMQLSSNTLCSARKGQPPSSLRRIGDEHFGLTGHEVSYCRGRAQNFLAEIREATVARNKCELQIKPTKFMVVKQPIAA